MQYNETGDQNDLARLEPELPESRLSCHLACLSLLDKDMNSANNDSDAIQKATPCMASGGWLLGAGCRTALGQKSNCSAFAPLTARHSVATNSRDKVKLRIDERL